MYRTILNGYENQKNDFSNNFMMKNAFEPIRPLSKIWRAGERTRRGGAVELSTSMVGVTCLSSCVIVCVCVCERETETEKEVDYWFLVDRFICSYQSVCIFRVLTSPSICLRYGDSSETGQKDRYYATLAKVSASPLLHVSKIFFECEKAYYRLEFCFR